MNLKDFGPENVRGFRYVLVVIDSLSKFDWTVPLGNKNDQTKIDSFENIFKTSNRKPNLIETDDGSEFLNRIFTDLLNKIKYKSYSRYTSLEAVFAEIFDRTIRDLLKKPVFEKGDGKWVDVLPTITKQYNIRIHSSTKLTLIQASVKKRRFCLSKVIRQKNENETKKIIQDIVRTAD